MTDNIGNVRHSFGYIDDHLHKPCTDKKLDLYKKFDIYNLYYKFSELIFNSS